MQQPALKFAPATTVSHEDFFGQGLSPVMTPDVLSVMDKYGAADVTPSEEDEDPQPQDLSEAVLNTPEVAAVLAKHKADAPESVKEPKVEKPEVKTEVKKPEVVAPEIVAEAPEIETVTAEQVSDEDQLAIPFHQVAALLHEKGLIVDIPENFPVDNVTQENFWELIDLNIQNAKVEEFNNGYESARTDLVNTLSEETLEVLNFQLANPNASPEEVRYHIERVLYAKDVSDLDPADPIDAETIIRQYLAIDNTPEEIEFQIKEARELNKLEQRAQLYKPKVEQRAMQQLQQSRQRQQDILTADAQRHQAFMSKVDNVLKQNTLLGIEIGQAERAKIRAIFANNRVPVPVNGGQTVELGMMDWLTRKNMYSPEGNVENLLLAALVLEEGPKALEKYIAAPVKKDAAIKFASQKSTGIFSAAPAASKQNTQVLTAEKKREVFWERFKQAQAK